MVSLLLILAVPVIPLLLPLAMPRKWALLGVATIALAAGLLLLNEHVIPSSEDGDRLGLAPFLAAVWFGTALIVTLVVLVKATSGGVCRRDALPSLAPIAILLAALFFHWLSNRLAGSNAPLVTHFVVAMVPLLIAAGAAFLWRGGRLSDTITLCIVVACLTVTALTGRATANAYRWRDEARAEAAGRPFCVLTYAGREHPRMATSVLQLSPMISRSGGRSFKKDRVPWIFVAGREPGEEWRLPRPRPACPLVPGGNV